MKFVNLTPHAVQIAAWGAENHFVTVTPEDNEPAARVATRRVAGPKIMLGDSVSIQTSRVEFGEVEGLPDPVPGIVYIVSGMVASRVNRSDVFAPGELVRDEKGVVIGCKGLTCSG